MTAPRPYAAERADPACETTPELARRLAAVPYRRFAVLGDSLSAGTGDATPGYEALGWSDRVGAALRAAHPDAAYLNHAVIGATTAEALHGQADRVAAFGPDLLHLPSGANDIARREVDFARVEQDLRRAYDFGAATGARLVTFTLGRAYVVPRRPDFTDRVRRVDELIRGLAAAYDAVVVDVWDHPVNDRPDLLSADGIHFATAGQAVLATEVVHALLAAPSGPGNAAR